MANIDETGSGAQPETRTDLNSVLTRNIAQLRRKRAADAAGAGIQERVAQAITAFAGRVSFIYIHLAIVLAWVAINLGITPVRVFDPTFVILATAASVEAIFLSTFVLIGQNRAALEADRRAELDLQANLLTEYELTRTLVLVAAIARKLGLAEADDPALAELKSYVAPEEILDAIQTHGRENER